VTRGASPENRRLVPSTTFPIWIIASALLLAYVLTLVIRVFSAGVLTFHLPVMSIKTKMAYTPI
jgi:hypothetical protein